MPDAQESSDDESSDDINLSEYEIRRKERIATNKKKFQEHLAAIKSAKTIKEVLSVYVTRFARRGLIHAPLQYTDFATTR